MAKGSNDLNMLLKAKVVKVKVELDINGSIVNLRKQVKAITVRLANESVKLKVVLDAKIGELSKQLAIVQTRLNNSKSFKPIKLKVDIDIKGSADLIKGQLKAVGASVDEFNKKFGAQINMMAQHSKKAQVQAQKTTNAMRENINVSSKSGASNISMTSYINQLKQAETQMRKTFGYKGNFSSFEFKDAEGNLRGFVGQLEKAQGVIQKVRYEFNKDKGSFQIVDQQTVTQTQKQLEKVVTALQNTKREIDKLGNASKSKPLLAGRAELVRDFKQLENLAKSGNITMGDVSGLQKKINKEKDLSSVYVQQKKLISDLAKARKAESREVQGKDYLKLMAKTKSTETIQDLKNVRLEYDNLNRKTKEYNDHQTQAQSIEKKRHTMLAQLNTASTNAVRATGSLSKEYISQTKSLIGAMKGTDQLRDAQLRLARINKEVKTQQNTEAQRVAIERLKKTVNEFAIATGRDTASASKYFEQLKNKAGNSVGAIEKHINRLKNSMSNNKSLRTLEQQTKSVVKHIGDMNNVKFKRLIDARDIDGLKKYIGELNRGQVATMKLVTDSKGMTRIVATMDSATKSARQYSYVIDEVNRKLRQTGTSDVFNANRNLGVFEQLRVAMARVPVWMASMTAFYGTIRAVRNMSREIIQVDTLMTNIRRVSSDNVNIDGVFKGAVGLSKELGNNLHNILESVGTFARTFGEFNDRQLIAITRTATLMSNVSDLTAQESTESLVGTMNAFNIEAEKSIRIVDAINEVDNNFAISTKQLAEGLNKSAATAVTFGATMEQTIGHITAIGSVTMESGKQIGNGLKTIYSRITTLEKSEEALNGIGIAIKTIGVNGEENVRPVNDILGELAGKWDSLSDSQRQNIAVDIAGRFQLTRFLALMNNYDTALSATNSAVFSHGSAMRENAEYMKSYEARINQLKNTFTVFALAIGDAFLSGAMMGVIEGLKNLAEMAVNVSNSVGVLPILFLALFAVFAKGNFLGTIIAKITLGLKAIGTEFTGATSKARGFQAGATTALTGVGHGVRRLSTKMNIALLRLKAGFVGLLAGTGVGLLFIGLGIAIEKLVSHFAEAKRKAEELKLTTDGMISSYRELGREAGVQKLISEYERLNGITNRTTEQQSDLDGVIADLSNRFPTMVDHIDAQGQAHLKTNEAMKEALEVIKELARIEGERTLAEFNDSILDQARNYAVLKEELKDINDTYEELKENDGKITEKKNNGHGRYVKDQTTVIDNTKKLLDYEMDRILKQDELNNMIRNSQTLIKEATVAYLDQEGKLGLIGDAQQKVIENMVDFNHETLRLDENSKEAQNTLFKLATSVGEAFADAHKEMANAISNNTDLSSNEKLRELDLLKTKFDDISRSIPPDMFMLDKEGNINKTVEEFEKVISVLSKMDDNTSFDTMRRDLRELGVDKDKAGEVIAKLAREQGNQVLMSEAQARGFEDVEESLDPLLEAMIEAISLTEKIFGLGSGTSSAMQSHVDFIKSMVRFMGEEVALSNEKVQESFEALGIATGLSSETIMKSYDAVVANVEGIEKYIDANGNLKDLTAEQIAMGEEYRAHVKELGREISIQEWLAHKYEGAKLEAIETTEKQIEANEDLVASEEEVSAKIEELARVLEETKNDFNDDTKSKWMNTIEDHLDELNEDFILVKDEAGNLKLEMANGESHPYLESLSKSLADLGMDFIIVEDDLGNFKVMLNDETGAKIFTEIGEDLGGMNIVLDESIEKTDIINEKEIAPVIDIDFLPLTEGLSDVQTSLADLETSFSNLEGNVSKIMSVEEALSSLSGLASNIADAFASLLTNSKSDLEGMATKANEAKTAVEQLKTAIDKIKKIASRIDVKGFEDILRASEDAEKATRNFGDELIIISEKAEFMRRGVKTATDETKKHIDDHKKAVDKLGDAYEDVEDDVKKAFSSMKDSLVTNTGRMIVVHDNQKSAIDKLKDSAVNAKKHIEGLNSTMLTSMSRLDNYISKAKTAQTSSKNTSNSTFMGFGFGGGTESSDSVMSAVNTFSAMAGEATGSSSGGEGGGTSGVLSGSRSVDGEYSFSTFAVKTTTKEKEEKADLFKANHNERKIASLSSSMKVLELIMERINKNSLSYRNNLAKVIQYQNDILKLSTKELGATQNRQKIIEQRLKSLKNTSKHTVKQREEYNKLMQEYEGNLSKIATLKSDLQSITNDIRNKSAEVFSDFIDEVVGKYDKAINKLKEKIENIDFQLEVLALVDPDNLKSQLDLLSKRSNAQQEERNTSSNKKDSMQSQYDKAVKKYGATSTQAKKVEEELKSAEKAWQSATLAVLKTEKEIKDIRGQVADDSINKLKDYYKNMKDMATKAIEMEKKLLEEAHKAKMGQYDEQSKAINKLYDDMFKKMDTEKSESDHQEQLDEKNTKKSELLYKINLLSRDTTLDGKKKLAELKKELVDAEKDISDFMKQRQQELLRAELEAQKEAQLEAIETQKENEQTMHDSKIEQLDAEQENISKHYDNILDNERMWAEKRNEFVKGNFSVLKKELEDMSKELTKMGSGNFDSLTENFKFFSEETKKQFAELNALSIDNLIFNADGTISSVGQVADSSKPKKVTTGTKVTTPSMTTKAVAPKTPVAPTPVKTTAPKANPVSSLPLRKGSFDKPKNGWNMGSVVDYVKSKGYHADFSDREKLFKHLKGSGTFGGTASQNDWLLKQLKIVGLRTGGYTGNDEGLAYLHKKELVLNENQTSDILNVAKIFDKIAKFIMPVLKRNDLSSLKNSDGNTNNYELTVNIDKLSGDKQGANIVIKEIMKGIKKLGK